MSSSSYFYSYVHVCASGHFRFHEAWDLCKLAGSGADWAALGKACLIHLEVELAIQVYRASGNVGMVLSLQGVQVLPQTHPLNKAVDKAFDVRTKNKRDQENTRCLAFI